MSKYVIVHGQMHEIRDDELMHWKYIKREKKNGKWVYTYDIGKDQKNTYDKAKTVYNTWMRQKGNAYVNNISTDRGIEDSDKPKAHVRDYYSWKKEDRLETKLVKAENAYSETPIAKREQRSAEAKKSAADAKNWIKDKLGYDEKAAAESATTKVRLEKYKADDKAKKNAEWKLKNPNDKQIKELADWQTNYHYDKVAEAAEKAREAVKAYDKTPLGVIENMGESLKSVKNWVDKLVGKSDSSDNKEVPNMNGLTRHDLTLEKQRIELEVNQKNEAKKADKKLETLRKQIKQAQLRGDTAKEELLREDYMRTEKYRDRMLAPYR